MIPESVNSVGNLLTVPINGNQSETVYSRSECSYTNLSERFKHEADFTRQFAHIYAVRLDKMRNIILKKAHKKWGADVKVRKLFELAEEESRKCVVIGTLFKHQVLKPSILKEISEENLSSTNLNNSVQLYSLGKNISWPHSHQEPWYVDDTDELILEDELQRIRLIGKLDVHSVVTGVVCAVFGHEEGDGKFIVDDYCWAGLSERISRPLETNEERFVVFLSGLDLANSGDILLPLQLLVDWIGGFLGGTEEQEHQAHVVRVIIAGNSIRGCADHKVPELLNSYKTCDKDTTSVETIKLLDDFIVQLTKSVDVDLMPGEFDPASHMMPQQPLHYCMFPQASLYKTFHGVTNPYECEIGGRRILGTSGQPIDDIAKFSKTSDPLNMLQNTLEWAHLAPTCPDTLSTYPYHKEDPFVISEYPDIYFAGNQPEYQTKLYEGPGGERIRLVCIPAFSKTHSCVVVNLNTLECYPMNFGTYNPTEGELRYLRK
ncbi:hypothetical protein L9F63_012082 [Diploptera punctata]|uniref:DNA polymerase delta small subunit n=1 Tax=Diploptera punctata TaxID=6984 RepID=A0AAD8AD89_DIPPU|nr:hypothetical protein L9F63_012082 [Diploptera punctata]